MKKVLIYIEPHPIRNNYEEFSDVGKMLVSILSRFSKTSDVEFRFFSNNVVVDKIIAGTPEASICSIRPTAPESELLQRYDLPWTEKTIEIWKELTLGSGQVSSFYQGVLDRIYAVFKFDCILLWSENGAVRAFCKKVGIPAIHGELGPTRSPFPQTMYFDPLGTNGNASSNLYPYQSSRGDSSLPPETWIAHESNSVEDEKNIKLIDAPICSVKYNEKIFSSRRFVFVPLQLSDDLNVIAHSNFKSMKDFLETVIPPILRQGYDVVIKGHPMAPSRPYNLQAEIEALAYARKFDGRVSIIERNAPANQTMNVMYQAEAVCTINSSIGYEALLLGKRVLILGRACYDIGGWLTRSSNLRKIDSTPHDESDRRSVITFMNGSYLQPSKAILESDLLIKIISFLIENHESDKASEAYWAKWQETFQSGFEAVTEGAQKARVLCTQGARALSSFTGAFGLKDKLAVVKGTSFYLFGDVDGVPTSCEARLSKDEFFGYLENVDAADEADETTLKIRGWALDKKAHTPPVAIIFSANSKVTSMHRVVSPREDVRSHLGTDCPLLSGFRFDVKIPKGTQAENCHLLLINNNNTVQIVRLATGKIGIRPSSEAPPQIVRLPTQTPKVREFRASKSQ